MKNLNKLILVMSVFSLSIFASPEYAIQRTIENRTGQLISITIMPSTTYFTPCTFVNSQPWMVGNTQYQIKKQQTLIINNKIKCDKSVNQNAVYKFVLLASSARKEIELPLVSDKKIVLTLDAQHQLAVTEE